MILENPGDQIVPGDRIVIRDDAGNFVKTIAVTSANLDRGRLVWDGIRYDGAAATPGAYDWYREAHEGEALLQADLLPPVLGTVDVVQTDDGLHLRVGFGDDDTQGCNARVTYQPAGVGGRPPRRVIDHKFWAQPPPGEVVDTVFHAAPGLYDLETLLWDVGGRHKVARSSQFLAGPTAGAADHPPARDQGVAAVGPNPTGGMVRWLFSVPAKGTVRARVIGIDGRCQRDWGVLEVRPGACELVWDGRSRSGVPVPAGKYFLVIDLPDGRRLSRSVVLAR